MKLSLSRHISPRAAVGVAVLAALVSLVSGREKPEPQQHAALDAHRVAPAPHAGASLDPDKLKRQAKDEAVNDLFPAPPSGAPGNAPRAQAEGATAPVVPPLPFRYLGKAVEADRTSVFVARGEEHYAVRAGDRIGRDYRVERISEKAVTFTYLPSRARQTLALPSSEPIVLE